MKIENDNRILMLKEAINAIKNGGQLHRLKFTTKDGTIAQMTLIKKKKVQPK